MSSEKSGRFFKNLGKRLLKSPTNPELDVPDNDGNRMAFRNPLATPNEPPPAYSETAHPSTPPVSPFNAPSPGPPQRPPRQPGGHVGGPRYADPLGLSPYPASANLLHPTHGPTSPVPASYPADRILRAPSPTPSVISRESVSNDTDQYAFLTQFDTSFLIDDSGSMALRERGAALTRWEEARSCIEDIAPICTAHDEDGIDVYFLNHKHRATPASSDPSKGPNGFYNVQSAGDVHEIFGVARPGGGTLTGTRLRSILNPYLTKLEKHKDDLDAVKPLNLIVITDGEAQDDVESVIAAAARKLDALDAAPYQLGIQFFQVGSDMDATDALRELDDELAGRAGARDVVDTVTSKKNDDGSPQKLTSDLILKTVLGSVVKKLDRK